MSAEPRYRIIYRHKLGSDPQEVRSSFSYLWPGVLAMVKRSLEPGPAMTLRAVRVERDLEGDPR